LSVVEACREICEHKPTASTAHDPAIPLMVYQLASVRVEVGTHEVASWDRGRNLSA
jgi:cytochrome b